MKIVIKKRKAVAGFGIITVLFLFAAVVMLYPEPLAAEVYPEPVVTYTSFTRTECVDNVCTASTYLGTEFVYEDYVWKHIDEARSLKGKGFEIVYMEDDPDFDIVVSDFNMTFIDMTLDFVGNPADYPTFCQITDALNAKCDFKLDEKWDEYDELGEEYVEKTQLKFQYKWEMKQGEVIKGDNVKYEYNGNIFQIRLKFGGDSTQIKIQAADTGNLADAMIKGAAGDSNYGADPTMRLTAQSADTYRNYIRYSLSDLPAAVTIENATAYYYYAYRYEGVGSLAASVYHVLNYTWEEGTGTLASAGTDGLTWNTQPCGAAWDATGNCNLTAQYTETINASVDIWYEWDVTNAVKREYDDGNATVSFGMKYDVEDSTDNGAFNTKENATAGIRPYLNITYTEPPIGPQWSGNITQQVTPQEYMANPDRPYGFQIDWTQPDNVTFESNFTGAVVNYTYDAGHIFNDSTTTYWINFTQNNMTVATHGYKWYAANDSAENSTEEVHFVVTKNTSTSIDMYLNGTKNAVRSVTWPSDANSTCVINRVMQNAFTMQHNDSYVGAQAGAVIEYNTDINGGPHNFTCNYTDSNYTDYTRAQVLTVNTAPATLGLFLNNTAGNTTLLNGSAINATATINYLLENVSILTNYTDWVQQNGTGSVENVSTMTVTDVPAGINVTAFTESINLTNTALSYFINLDDVEVDAETYLTNLLGGQTQTITATFGVPAGVGADNLYGTLIYNDTVYTNNSVVTNDTHIKLSATFTTPDTTEDNDTVNFFWNYSYADKLNFTSGIHSQTIGTAQLVVCGGALSNTTALIISSFNETNDFGIVNASMDMLFEWSTLGTDYTHNTSYTNETYHLCIYPTWAEFDVNATVKYTANISGYQTRYYYITNSTVTNTTSYVSLYNIDSVDGTRVDIRVQNPEGEAEEEVYISAQRWYNDLNQYRTVTMAKTNENGDATTYLHLYDVEYRFVLEQDLAVVHTVDRSQITSNSLTITIDPTLASELFNYYGKIGVSCTNTTTFLECEIVDTSGLMLTSCLNVTEFNATHSTEICGDCATSSSTVLGCSLGTNTTDKTFTYTVSATMNQAITDFIVLEQNIIDFMTHDLSDTLGLTGVFMAAVFIMTVVMTGVWYPPVGVLLSLVGVGFSIAMGLLNIPLPVYGGLVAAGVLFIYMFSRND